MKTRTLRIGELERDGGFTLIELLIVIAIIGLITGVSLSRFGGASSQAELLSSARKVASGLRLARSEAIAKNLDSVFTLDVKNRTFRIGNGKAEELSRELDLSLYTAESELVETKVGSIRFFPDGSSTGGRVSVMKGEPVGGKTIMNVNVDWVTGRVSIIE